MLPKVCVACREHSCFIYEIFQTCSNQRGNLFRLPFYKDGKPLLRHYCPFWRKDNSTHYVEGFSKLLYERFQPAQIINK